MAFFPLLNTTIANGFTTVHNFSPNNWENQSRDIKTVWAIYSDGTKWQTKKLDTLEIGSSKTYYYNDLVKVLDSKFQPLILLQLRKSPFVTTLDSLPEQEYAFTHTPEWRATVGLNLSESQTSYQGEINPFPKRASLLTFHPFIQYQRIKNYFLFMNTEKLPDYRESSIEIYEANSRKFIDEIKVFANHANLIELDQYCFSPTDLPVFISRTMAGIPFGLGVSEDNTMLSLEHTHPPASFSVHGERFKVQAEIKRQWFNTLTRKK